MPTPPRVLARLAGLALVAVAALPAHASVRVYGCILDGRQEVGPTGSSAQGAGRFVIDTDANTVFYRITFAGLSGAETAAHIHGSGAPGANAGVVEPLPAGNPKVGVWHYAEAQETMILNGLCYANIHTAANPGGEIRGQIVPFNALLDAAQEVPTNASTGKGWATFTVDTVANSLSYYISYAGLTGVPNNAHFHGNALPGTSAAVKVAIPGFATSPVVGSVNYLEADQAALLAGRWYVNLHTAANPGGEVRGQVVPTVIPLAEDEAVAIAVPAPNSSAYALVSIDTQAHALGFDVHLLALSGAETLTHIHGFALPGTDGPIQLGLPLGPRKIGTWAYGAANEADVLSGLAYLNAHTSANPNGEIRGQINYLPGSTGTLDVTPGGPRLTGGLSAAPNPFGSRTVLSFQLARTGSVSLSIVDLSGREVRNVPATVYAPGPHSFDWDGMDDAGQPAAPGIYFAIVRTPEGVRTTRMARLR